VLHLQLATIVIAQAHFAAVRAPLLCIGLFVCMCIVIVARLEHRSTSSVAKKEQIRSLCVIAS